MGRSIVKDSKFLSMVLRHGPGQIGIQLDEQGWVDVETLLEALSQHGRPITLERLEEIVEKNDKKRFVIQDGNIITGQNPASSHGVAEKLEEHCYRQDFGVMKMHYLWI